MPENFKTLPEACQENFRQTRRRRAPLLTPPRTPRARTHARIYTTSRTRKIRCLLNTPDKPRVSSRSDSLAQTLHGVTATILHITPETCETRTEVMAPCNAVAELRYLKDKYRRHSYSQGKPRTSDTAEKNESGTEVGASFHNKIIVTDR